MNLNRVRSWFGVNPIIVKELRSRMRGPRAFITLTAALVFMGLVMGGALQLMLTVYSYGVSGTLSAQIGQGLFTMLGFLLLLLVCAVAPAVTAGAVSGEQEKQTYEMLMATPLSPTRILWGKLISALTYVFLLIFAAIPLSSLVFTFGGVSYREMIKTLIMLIVIAVSMGILGLFYSAMLRRSGPATIVSYLTVVALTFIPMVAATVTGIVRGNTPPHWLLTPSPISLLSSTMVPAAGNTSGMELFFLLGGMWGPMGAPISTDSIPRPVYHYGIALYGLISIVLFLFTTRLVRPTQRWRFTRRELLATGLVLLAFVVVVGGAFLLTADRYEWAINPTPPTDVNIMPGVNPAVPAVEPAIMVDDLPPTPTPIPVE